MAVRIQLRFLVPLAAGVMLIASQVEATQPAPLAYSVAQADAVVIGRLQSQTHGTFFAPNQRDGVLSVKEVLKGNVIVGPVGVRLPDRLGGPSWMAITGQALLVALIALVVTGAYVALSYTQRVGPVRRWLVAAVIFIATYVILAGVCLPALGPSRANPAQMAGADYVWHFRRNPGDSTWHAGVYLVDITSPPYCRTFDELVADAHLGAKNTNSKLDEPTIEALHRLAELMAP